MLLASLRLHLSKTAMEQVYNRKDLLQCAQHSLEMMERKSFLDTDYQIWRWNGGLQSSPCPRSILYLCFTFWQWHYQVASPRSFFNAYSRCLPNPKSESVNLQSHILCPSLVLHTLTHAISLLFPNQSSTIYYALIKTGPGFIMSMYQICLYRGNLQKDVQKPIYCTAIVPGLFCTRTGFMKNNLSTEEGGWFWDDSGTLH